jgi:hypothetical protein
MSIDRHAARRRVKRVTGWTAAGAAALTAGLAFGASRDGAATSKAAAPAKALPAPSVPDSPGSYPGDPPPAGGYGYTPPAASSAPPEAMSGGS